MKKLIIDKGIFYQRIAILNNDFVEFVDYNINQELSIGDIYLGKVKVINNANKSAFVELAEGIDAYLAEGVKNIKQGELILVQVNKEAFGNKLPSVTRDLSLAGRNLILLPIGKGLKYSRKLNDIENLKPLISELNNSLENSGAILRSSADVNCKEDILQELEILQEEYNSYLLPTKLSNKPKLIKKAVQNYEEILNSKREALEIIVNYKALYNQLKKSNYITLEDKLILKETSLFSVYGISEDDILGSSYNVNGCELVIEKTEAMTVVDVNSKGKEINFNREVNILEINLSLCSKLVELIILKNISGIIIVDFISMKDKSNKEILINKLKQEFKVDRNSVKIMEITSLGLVQIVRERQGKSLLEKLTNKCSSCNGRGYEPNKELEKIRIEEQIKLQGYDQVSGEIIKCENLFNEEEIEMLERLYKRLI